MRHWVCLQFLPKAHIMSERARLIFCGRHCAQPRSTMWRDLPQSEVQQSFIPLSLHSWLRHIGAAHAAKGFKRIRSYGVQARRRLQVKEPFQAAHQGLERGPRARSRSRPLTTATLRQAPGRDPSSVRTVSASGGVVHLHPTYGVI